MYLAHPGSMILMLLVMLSAIITFTVLIFLIAYILVHGVPYIKPSLFSLHYTSENASLMPALINTIIMTFLSLLIAVPFGIFAAVFLVEYAKRGNKFMDVIRLTTETLSGIPSIVYGLFGMLFFVNTLGWGLLVARRSIYIGNYDSSIDHASDRGVVKIGTGLISRRKLWFRCRKTSYRIPYRTSVSCSGNTGRCDSGNRPYCR